MKYEHEFEAFANRVRETLIPALEETNIFVALTPSDPSKLDVKFCVELGLAVMLNKPIIVVHKPGMQVPGKLLALADKVIEMDYTREGMEKLTDALQEFIKGTSGDEVAV